MSVHTNNFVVFASIFGIGNNERALNF